MWLDDLNTAPDGATIAIPPGIYVVDPIVITGKAISLLGRGKDVTKIRLKKSGNLLTVSGGSITISGVDLDGNKASIDQSPYAVIECISCVVRIEDAYVRNGKEFGLDCRGCASIELDRVITANCGDKGVVGAALYFRDGCGSVTITNCKDFGSGLTGGAEGAAVQTADCESLIVDGYYSQDAAKYAIKLQASGAQLSRICIVRNGGLAAISLQGDRYSLGDIFIRDGIGSGIDVIRFAINSTDRQIVIKDASIERQTWNGIYILNQFDAEQIMGGITIENATINRCQYGIRLRGKVESVIDGASLMDNQRGFWSQGDLIGSPTECALSDVDAFGVDTTPINGFTILEGSGVLRNCRAWGNITNYNGNAYIR